MTQVTVEYEDLECIVFATAAIKQIEGALQNRKTDPFVRPHFEYTEAHDRLASAMRNAKRAESDALVNWDGPLDREEANALRYISQTMAERREGLQLFVISPEDKGEPGRQMSVYDRLGAKGCIEVGQFVQGVVWAGAPAPQITADPKGYAARITPRGYEKLKALPPEPERKSAGRRKEHD